MLCQVINHSSRRQVQQGEPPPPDRGERGEVDDDFDDDAEDADPGGGGRPETHHGGVATRQQEQAEVGVRLFKFESEVVCSVLANFLNVYVFYDLPKRERMMPRLDIALICELQERKDDLISVTTIE